MSQKISVCRHLSFPNDLSLSFLRRQKYRKDPKDYSLPNITYRDLAVGSILEINRYKLEMYACDNDTKELEKVLNYD